MLSRSFNKVMYSIYKYPLRITDSQIVMMPGDATILTVQEQNGKLCLWATVDVHAEHTARSIHIFGTGHPIPNLTGFIYIGTAQLLGMVWHVCEEL
jgi:hypothetical protein